MGALNGIEDVVLLPSGDDNRDGAYELTIECVDPEGETSTSRLYLGPLDNTHTVENLLSIASGIAGAFANLVNAQVRRYTIGVASYTSQSKPPKPVGAPDNIEDKAQVIWESDTGRRFSISFPMPKTSDFMNDLETVKPDDLNVTTFSEKAINGFSGAGPTVYLTDATGRQQAAAYVSGKYRRAKTRSKMRAGISTEMGG